MIKQNLAGWRMEAIFANSPYGLYAISHVVLKSPQLSKEDLGLVKGTTGGISKNNLMPFCEWDDLMNNMLMGSLVPAQEMCVCVCGGGTASDMCLLIVLS